MLPSLAPPFLANLIQSEFENSSVIGVKRMAMEGPGFDLFGRVWKLL